MTKASRTPSSSLLLVLLLSCVIASTHASFGSFLPEDLLKAAEQFTNPGALGGSGEGCKYKCADGSAPVADPKHIPTANGCGTSFMQIKTEFVETLTSCCNWHDKCFGTCNKDYAWCEKGFKKCMGKKCATLATTAKQEACQGEADLYSGVTTLFGCTFYTDAQAEACTCKPEVAAGKPKIAAGGEEDDGDIDFKAHLDL